MEIVAKSMERRRRHRARDGDEGASSCRSSTCQQCQSMMTTTSASANNTATTVRRKQLHRRRQRNDSSLSLSTTVNFATAMRSTTAPSCRRNRRRRRSRLPSLLLSLFLSLHPHLHHHNHHHQSIMTMLAQGYVITWNNGPEDNYFCGTTYDDPTTDCTLRQNCRSGRDDECDGYADGIGIKCFADTPCDSKEGGGSAFVPHSTASILIPTNSPAAAGTDDYEHISDHPSDHWYCGIGFDDAESRCEVHCPNQTGCPTGELCYFGTSCDARTDAPTVRPTKSPTMMPTRKVAPGPTMKPTLPPLTETQSGFFCGSSWSDVTSNCKKRCPSGEDPECPGGETCFAFTGCLQENGYGSDPAGWVPGYDEWGNPLPNAEGFSDAANGDGNDEEGGEGEGEASCVDTVITITADNWPNEITWTIINVDTDEEVAAGVNDDLVPLELIKATHCLPILEEPSCYQFTIKDGAGDGICCDSGEGSYVVKYDGKVIKEGASFYDSESVEFGCDTQAEEEETTAVPSLSPTNKRLGSGSSGSSSGSHPAMSSNSEEATTYVPSLRPTKMRLGSTQQGSNSVESSAPSTSTDEESRPTTSSPTSSSLEYVAMGGDSNSSSSSSTTTITPNYRCVAKALVDDGYQVTAELCDAYIDCYNKYIDTGDAWYCAEDEICIETDCGMMDSSSSAGDNTSDSSSQEEATSMVEESDEDTTETPIAPAPLRPTSSTGSKPVATPTTLMPTKLESMQKEDSSHIPTIVAEPLEQTVNSTETLTVDPTLEPTGNPTETITLEPTGSPTEAPLGPCEGEPCPLSTYCRSQYGFCGPGEDYCTDTAIWSKDCPANEPTLPPSEAITSSSPSLTPSPASRDVPPSPTSSSGSSSSFEKPQGGGKGESGSKVSPSPSSAPNNGTSSIPTIYSDFEDTDDINSDWPSSKPDNDTTSMPTKYSDTEEPVDINSDTQIDIITESPTFEPSAGDSMESNSAVVSSSASLEKNEFSCTGEPCEEDSWCRSSYGSCGPGFIYCNANTIWDNSCPPIAQALETRPTRTPTIMMTEVPTIIKEMGEMISAPSLPALPMPTLPTITEGTGGSANFLSQSPLELHAPTSSGGGTLGEEDFFEPALSDTGEEEESETELREETEVSSTASPENPGFDEWLAFTASMNSGEPTRHVSSWNLQLSVVLFASALLFYELPWNHNP